MNDNVSNQKLIHDQGGVTAKTKNNVEKIWCQPACISVLSKWKSRGKGRFTSDKLIGSHHSPLIYTQEKTILIKHTFLVCIAIFEHSHLQHNPLFQKALSIQDHFPGHCTLKQFCNFNHTQHSWPLIRKYINKEN